MNYIKSASVHKKSDIPKQNTVKKNDIQERDSKPVQKNETKQISVQNKPDDVNQDKPPELNKNQLTAGNYIIGKDIPVGRFDFEVVWGKGVISKYKYKKADNNYNYDDRNYDQAIGIEIGSPFYKQYLVTVVCLDGEFLRITGNVIVNIKRSKDIELDL